MTTQVIIVLLLTFLINLITTLSYSVRIVGIRTGRIAISFALFNILVLVSRTANGFQASLENFFPEHFCSGNSDHRGLVGSLCILFKSRLSFDGQQFIGIH